MQVLLAIDQRGALMSRALGYCDFSSTDRQPEAFAVECGVGNAGGAGGNVGVFKTMDEAKEALVNAATVRLIDQIDKGRS